MTDQLMTVENVMIVLSIVVLIIFNVGTFWILSKILSSRDIKEALKEKELTSGSTLAPIMDPASAKAITEAETKADAAIAALKEATTKAAADGAGAAESANLVKAQAASDLAVQQFVSAARSAGPHSDTSYSRVAGMVGATVLATFFWAVGNIVIVRSLDGSGTNIASMLEGLSGFFLSGAALFLPYGVNQLRAAFDKPKTG